MFLRGGQDIRPRHHHPQINNLIAIALENHADDVFANIMHIALHGRHDDTTLGLLACRLLRLDKGDEVGNRLLHHAR